LLSSSAKADDPAFQRPQCFGRKATAYGFVQSSRTMTAEAMMSKSRATVYAALAGGNASTE
jgi:hypothetical protein